MSCAKLGPERIAAIATGAVSAMISVMNFCVPRSMPLAEAITAVPRGEMRRERAGRRAQVLRRHGNQDPSARWSCAQYRR